MEGYEPTDAESEANAKRQTRVAEVLYDEMTGRHEASGENVVLKPLSTGPMTNKTPRHERELHELNMEAMARGYHLYPMQGDRWSLSLRLADRVLSKLGMARGRLR